MRGLPLKVEPEMPAHSLYEGIEYREFWDDTQRQILDQHEQSVVQKLLPASGRRIIDVGCGFGRLSDCYLERFNQVIMVDGSISLLRQAYVKTGGRAVYIAADATHLPFRNASFDSVLMIRVFHHIPDSGACLNELHRILCNEGRFVFSYRNKQNLLRVIQWLIGKNKENPFTEEPAGIGSTLISHRPKAIHEMLHDTGFNQIRYSGVGVLDWLASKIGFMRRWVDLGVRLAPIFGRFKIAPWILVGADGKGTASLLRSTQLIDLLQCPACGGDIFEESKGYACQKCGRLFSCEDGIIDMRI